MNVLLPLLIAVPLAGAALSLLFIRWRPVQRAISLACAGSTTAISCCTRAGASRGLIAHYFDSKEELLLAALTIL